jgi:hypothetical protein
MLRKLSMCLICFGLSSGMGCKSDPASRGADLATGVGGAQTQLSIQPALRGKVSYRGEGKFSVSSPDGAQVINVKPGVIGGKEVGLYQVCEATGPTLKCSDWTPMVSACPQCSMEPCPCTNPICAPVCKPQ